MNIGITMSESKTQYYINQAYIDYIHKAGMQPFMLTKNHNINMMVGILDGIILPGGIDIDPIYYGEDNYTSYGTSLEKDNFERAVFHIFRKAGKPIFGICRGFQLIIREYLNFKPKLNNFLDFWTHIPHHSQVDGQQLDRSACQHFVEFLPNLLYNKTTEIATFSKVIEETLSNRPVNSMHHQSLVVDFGKNRIIGAQGFKMLAWTTRGLTKVKKGTNPVVCEAFRISNWGAPILAVQWHPEELEDIELISNFFLNPYNLTKKNTPKVINNIQS